MDSITLGKSVPASNTGSVFINNGGNQNVSISFKDDGTGNRNNPGANDFHTVKRRYKKFAEKGWDKDSANRWLNKSIEKTKETMGLDPTATRVPPYPLRDAVRF